MAERSTRLAARLWWATLPYEGWVAWGDDGLLPCPWWAHPLAWLHRLAEKLPGGSQPFKPRPPVVCNCDYCRGVPGAVFEP